MTKANRLIDIFVIKSYWNDFNRKKKYEIGPLEIREKFERNYYLTPLLSHTGVRVPFVFSIEGLLNCPSNILDK